MAIEDGPAMDDAEAGAAMSEGASQPQHDALPIVQGEHVTPDPSGRSAGGSGGFQLAVLDDLLNQARARSLWPLTFGLACCAIEMMAAGAARFDLDRFGAGVFRPSPRQADVMILAGTISRKMAPTIQALWDQMPAPKWGIAMGGCTISGGPFKYPAQYAIVEGGDELIPIDVYIPGCPPRPEALIQGILLLEEKIKAGRKFDQ